MKKPAWLTRKILVRGVAALAIGGAAIALVYGIQSGTVKAGIGADETITKSEKRDKNGNITETTTTTIFQDAKTLWDWLSLLGVPFSLAILGYVLQQLQQTRAEQQAKTEKEIADQRAKAEKEIAESNQREEALQNYLDRLADLLIDKNVIATAGKLQERIDNHQGLVPIEEFQETTHKEIELVNAATDVIRARTLSILRRLGQDGERKGDVIRFLIEAEVISKLKLNFSLSGVKLSGADLIGANLTDANLTGAELTGANLSDGNLSFADLSRADLSRGNLSFADLSRANLSRANLTGANLTGANLSFANLTDANLTDANLHSAELHGATLFGANLHSADLSFAKLMCANLIGSNLTGVGTYDTNFSDANLSRADLSDADLSGAKNWIEARLPLAKLCKTILPEECNLNPNRDCEALGIPLDPPATESPE